MNRTLTIAAAGLAACTPKNLDITPAEVPTPASLEDGFVDRAEFETNATAAADALERLAGLELIVVGALIVDAPEATGFCYGPCAEEPVDQAWMQEHALQVARLEAFVEVAESVATTTETVGSADFDASEAISLLNQLELVEVEAVDWDMSGACYVSLCPSDDVRRAAVQRLVAGSRTL